MLQKATQKKIRYRQGKNAKVCKQKERLFDIILLKGIYLSQEQAKRKTKSKSKPLLYSPPTLFDLF